MSGMNGGDWTAAREFVRQRMEALGMTVEDVSRETRLAVGTVRYFGLNPATKGTVTLLNTALKLPDGYLHRVIGGEAVEAVSPPDSVEVWLTRIDRKLDEVLAVLSCHAPGVPRTPTRQR